ncbi:TANK-binding kinase 1-binding protein 1 isoform X2 [Lepisosteus oculatus]
MESLFGGEMGLLGGEGLKEDGCRVGWPGSPLPDDVYSASHFALITAYHDIKTRLAGLERENSSLKRKLKIYEIKFPTISDFGEERNSYCSFESKETALLQSENGSLQRQVNQLTHELQKSKEREEQLEDVIQAYEKIHMEKSNLQRDLDKMTTLAEKHVERIRGLEAALRQRDGSLQKLNSQLHSKEVQYLQLHASPDISHLLDCPSLMLQSSRSLDALSDLKLQRLEAELEGARHEAQGACRREAELKAECERLQGELQRQQVRPGGGAAPPPAAVVRRDGNATSARLVLSLQEMAGPCEQCDVEWIKKAGDEQVNLALAYTELTEELCRLQTLCTRQTEILRRVSQEQSSPVQRHSPVPQRHSPVPQRHSPVPQRHSPAPQRRSPVLQRLSPDVHRRSPLPEISDGPASYSCRPASHHLRASFQGRRSYSEVSDPSAYQRPARFPPDPVSTLPKPRPYGEGYLKQQQQPPAPAPSPLPPPPPPPPPHQSPPAPPGPGGGGSPRHAREVPFPLSELPHLRFEQAGPPAPAPAPQSSEDEEEWVCPPETPPGSLGAGAEAAVVRGTSTCAAFPIAAGPGALSCHAPGYLQAEHAQSWPSINLWMETEDNDIRSCPLCQLAFPIGYPDDALIKHIDTHLENSKI